MLKEVMNDLWLARISSLSNEVGLYVVLLGSVLESPKIWIYVFKPETIKGYIFKNKRINCRFLKNIPLMCHSSLHDKYAIVPAGKTSNNIVFVCKSYYFECLIKELGINNNTSSNTTYKPTSFDKDEILANDSIFVMKRVMTHKWNIF
jgi:hypothetical protein